MGEQVQKGAESSPPGDGGKGSAWRGRVASVAQKSWMKPTGVFVTVGALSLAIFWFVYQRPRTVELQQRSFRELSSAALRLDSTIQSYGKVVVSFESRFSDSGGADATERKDLSSGLSFDECKRAEASDPAEEEVRTTSYRRDGMELVIRHGDCSASLQLEGVFDRVLRLSGFEVVLVVQPDETVLHQIGLSEHVAVSLRGEGEVDEGKVAGGRVVGTLVAGQEGGSSESQFLAGVATTGSVRIGATEFRAFAIPTRLGATLSEADQESESAKVENARPWWLVGLVREQTLRERSTGFSRDLLVLAIVLIGLAVVAYPFCRLTLMGPAEDVTGTDLLTTLVLGFVGLGLVWILALDLWAYGRLRLRTYEATERLAEAAHSDLTDELVRAGHTLDRFEQLFAKGWDSKESRVDCPSAGGNGGVEPALAALELKRCEAAAVVAKVGCELEADCGQKTVPSDTARTADWPLFLGDANEQVFVVDTTGDQIAKWSPQSSTTPFVNVAEREYFKGALRQSPSSQGMLLDSIRSWTRGTRVGVLSRRATAPTTGESAFSVLCATLPLRAVNGIPLPRGTQLAVVDQEGLVLFHSDQRRNLAENLLVESEQDPGLRALLLEHEWATNSGDCSDRRDGSGCATRRIQFRYRGQGVIAAIRPVELDGPVTRGGQALFLVAMRDLDAVTEFNFGLLTVAVRDIALFVLAFLVLATLARLLRLPGLVGGPWLRPRHVGHHIDLTLRACALVALSMIALFLSSFLSMGEAMPLHVRFALVALLFLGVDLVEWRWGSHDGRRVPVRVRGAQVFLALVGAVALIVPPRIDSQARYLVFALLLAVPAIAVVFPHPRNPLDRMVERLTSRLPGAGRLGRFRWGYTASLAALLLLTCVIPTTFLFSWSMGRALDAHARALRIEEQGVRLAQMEVEAAKGRSGLWPPRFVRSTLAEASLFEQIAPEQIAGQQSAPEGVTPEQGASEAAVPDQGRNSVWGRNPLRPTGVFWDLGELFWQMRREPVKDWRFLRQGSGLLLAALATVLVCVSAGIWFAFFLLDRVTLLRVKEPPWLDDYGKMTARRSIFFVAREAAPIERYVDARRFDLTFHLATIVEDGPRGLEDAMKPGISSVLFLDEQAYIADPERLQTLVPMLLTLIERGKKVVSVVTSLSPAGAARVSWRDEGDQLQEQWRSLMEHFVVIDGDLRLRQESLGEGSVHEAQAEIAKGGPHPGFGRVVGPLSDIAEPELDEAMHDEDLTAAKHYRYLVDQVRHELDDLWWSCSDKEKSVLRALALHGYANEKRAGTVRRLLARGLIVRRPLLALFSESFRFYVAHEADPVGPEVWAQGATASSWASLRTPYVLALVALAAFFLATQRHLFDWAIGIAAAFSALMPLFLRLIAVVGPAAALPLRGGGDRK